MIKKLINKIYFFWSRRTNHSFINYLRKTGVKIGEDCVFRDVMTARIDISRPSLVTIGSNVNINTNFTLLTHDFVSGIFVNLYNDFIPSHKRVEIGNNVRFGINCTVLSGSKIGDNCFVAANSLVNKVIPPNSVVAGVPARVICTIDEYYERRKLQYIEEVIDYAISIKERFGREPSLADFTDDYPVFVDGGNFDRYPNMPYSAVFSESQLEAWKINHKAPFDGFENFIKAVNNIQIK